MTSDLKLQPALQDNGSQRATRLGGGHVAPTDLGESTKGPLERLWQARGELAKIATFGAADAFARGLNWGTMMLLAFMLPSSGEYGQVSLLVSIEMIAASILCMGLDRAVLRFFAEHDAPRSLLRSVLIIWGTLAWLPLPAILLLWLTGHTSFFGIPLAPDLLLLTFCIAIFNLNSICVCVSRAEHDLTQYLRFRVVYLGLKAAFVLLIAGLLASSLSYVIGVTVASLAMLPLILPLVRERIGGQTDWPLVHRLAIFGSPLVFHMIGGSMLAHFSRFFLQSHNSSTDVGLFAFACTLGSSVFFLYSALSTFFEPRIYSFVNDKSRNERWLAYYTNAAVALAAGSATVLLIIYPYLISYLPKEYDQAAPIIPLVIASVLIQPLLLQGNYRLATYQKTMHIAYSTLLGGSLNVLLCFLLIPSYGIWGAAVALCCATFIQCGYIFAVSLYVGGITWRHPGVSPTFLVCVCGALAVAIGNQSKVVIPALIAVCVSAVGLLYRSFTHSKEQSA